MWGKLLKCGVFEREAAYIHHALLDISLFHCAVVTFLPTCNCVHFLPADRVMAGQYV